MQKRKINENEWRAKRVWTNLDRKAKSSYAYKNSLGKYRNSVKIQSIQNGKINPYAKKSPKIQTEVVVKVTGSSKNFGSLKAHLRYISRDGELAVETNEFEIFKGKNELKDLNQTFNKYNEILTQADIKNNSLKEKREALHIVFSMRDIEHASPSKIKESAMKTISEIYPNNHYAIAVHNDTDNPHCHLVLKVKDIFGNRINPRKKDLQKMREKFADNLRDLGINATATKRKDREYRYEYPKTYNQSNHKPHHYEVIDFGRAPYKFNADNKMSYFVKYRTSKGKDIDIWADDLERVVKENNIQKGEYVRFAIIDENPIEVKIQDKKSNQWYQKTVYKKIWDASIESRAEKVLNPLKNFTANEYKLIVSYKNSMENEKGDLEKNNAFKEAQMLSFGYEPTANNSIAPLKANSNIIAQEPKQSNANAITQAEMEAIKKLTSKVANNVLNLKNKSITKKEKSYG